MSDKAAFNWETQVSQQVTRHCQDEQKLSDFLAAVRSSERVTTFVKDKSDDELLKYYLFTQGEYLTNLGILWIGRRTDRAKLAYAPVVQFIKYDETDRKVNKLDWDDFSRNPQELIEAVWREVPDWREGYELPDGLFRRLAFFDEFGGQVIAVKSCCRTLQEDFVMM